MKGRRTLNLDAVKPRALRDLYRQALAGGADVRLTGSGHIRVQTADGIAIGPSTTDSYGRALPMTRARLNKIGALPREEETP